MRARRTGVFPQESDRCPRWLVTDALARAHVLLQDLVRPQPEGGRDREAERLRGLEIDHQLELGGLLDRQVGGPRALEDLVHEGGGALPDIVDLRAIGDQPAASTYWRSSYRAGSRCLAASSATRRACG